MLLRGLQDPADHIEEAPQGAVRERGLRFLRGLVLLQQADREQEGFGENTILERAILRLRSVGDVISKKTPEEPKELKYVLFGLLDGSQLLHQDFDQRDPQADLALADIPESGVEGAPNAAILAIQKPL